MSLIDTGLFCISSPFFTAGNYMTIKSQLVDKLADQPRWLGF